MSVRTPLLAALLALLISAAPAWALPGDLDPSFDGDGIRVLDGRGLYGAQSVLVQPDGKIVITTSPLRGLGTFGVVRLHPDGRLDTSFDEGMHIDRLLNDARVRQDVEKSDDE